MENINLALTLLLAGFIIVFMVLILLIIIITVYGKLVQAAQRKSLQNKEKKKRIVSSEKETPAPQTVQAHIWPTSRPDPDEIPGEIIAAIAAAVDSVYGSKPHRIKSVKRSGSGRSAWGNTGVMQNTRPF